MKNIPVVIFAIVFSAVTAFSQYTVYVPTPPVINIYPQFEPLNMHLQREYLRTSTAASSQPSAGSGKSGRAAVSKSRSTAARPKIKSATDFTSTADWILPERLSRAMGKTPAQISEIKQRLGSFLHTYETLAANDNVSPDDLSYGLAFFIVNNYVVVNDSKEINPALKSKSDESTINKKAAFSDAVQKIIRKQVKDSLTSNPAIAKLTDRQKQEFTEMLVIVTVTNYYMYEIAGKSGTAENFAQARNETRQLLEKILGVPADKIKITENGLEFR